MNMPPLDDKVESLVKSCLGAIVFSMCLVGALVAFGLWIGGYFA